MTLISVMIVEKQALMRSALLALVKAIQGLDVVGEATGPEDALLIAASAKPAIALVNLEQLSVEAAIALLSKMQVISPDTQFIGIAMQSDIENELRIVRAGVMGVVRIDESADVLSKAIQKVHAGEVWLERKLLSTAMRQLTGVQAGPSKDPEAAKVEMLSKRQREIITLVCRGLQNKLIGEELAISEATVRHHLTSIYAKLAVKNRLELYNLGFRHGLMGK